MKDNHAYAIHREGMRFSMKQEAIAIQGVAVHTSIAGIIPRNMLRFASFLAPRGLFTRRRLYYRLSLLGRHVLDRLAFLSGHDQK